MKETEKLKTELDSLREELHAARKQIVDLEKRVPDDRGDEKTADANSVAILLDQATWQPPRRPRSVEK